MPQRLTKNNLVATKRIKKHLVHRRSRLGFKPVGVYLYLDTEGYVHIHFRHRTNTNSVAVVKLDELVIACRELQRIDWGIADLASRQTRV